MACIVLVFARASLATDERAQVENVVRSIIAADMAGDLSRVLSLYAENATLISPNGPDIAGIEAISEHYERLFASTELRIDNEIQETVVSGNMAMTRGINHVTATPKSGGPSMSGSDKYLMILVRDAAGSWRISHLIWTPQAK